MPALVTESDAPERRSNGLYGETERERGREMVTDGGGWFNLTRRNADDGERERERLIIRQSDK